MIVFFLKMRSIQAECRGVSGSAGFVIFFLEREKLLSKFSANPIVGSLRGKKESCSTRRGLHVGTGFEEF